MPVALLRAEPPGYAPWSRPVLTLGSDPACDLVDVSPGVAPRHATLRRIQGEFLLTAEDGLRIHVGGGVEPMMALREGDRVGLAPRAPPWIFRNRMADAFWPNEVSLARAWAAHPAFGRAEHGPEGLGGGRPLGAGEPGRSLRVQRQSGDFVVKRLAPARAAGGEDQHLTLLLALGGAPHPGLASVVDGGLAAGPARPVRWMATRWVPGRPLGEVVDRGGLPPEHCVRLLGQLAAALDHLHARGVVHRDVAPGNIVLTPAGAPVLIDYGQSVLVDPPTTRTAGVVGTPGYVPPEEILQPTGAVAPAGDIYGLAAVGYALLTGAPPARGEDLLSTLSRAARPPTRLDAMGVAVPQALETVLFQALDPDPRKRPGARALRLALAWAESQMRLGDPA